MQEALGRFREKYVEEHGEQPPEELMDDARQWILKAVAQQNRDIYDALADE